MTEPVEATRWEPHCGRMERGKVGGRKNGEGGGNFTLREVVVNSNLQLHRLKFAGSISRTVSGEGLGVGWEGKMDTASMRGRCPDEMIAER